MSGTRFFPSARLLALVAPVSLLLLHTTPSRAAWELHSSGSPETLWQAASVIDPARQSLFVFGGQGSQTLKDLWELDLAAGAWHRWEFGGGPAARALHAMTFDSTRRRLMVFGGRTANRLSSELWEFSPATGQWTNATPGTGPSSREDAAAVYDPVDQKMYLFGGRTLLGGSSVSEELWTYTPSTHTWNLIPVTGGPPARCGHGLAADPEGRALYLFGGMGNSSTVCGYQQDFYFNDLWRFDLATGEWTELQPPDGPMRRAYHGTGFDAGRGKLYVFGGRSRLGAVSGVPGAGWLQDFWEFDPADGKWMDQTPSGDFPARERPLGGYNPATGDVVIMSGYDGHSIRGDALVYRTGADLWEELSLEIIPHPRADHSLIYDPAHGTYYLFGGFEYKNESRIFGSLWEFDPAMGKWGTVPVASGPEARFSQAAAFDSARGKLVVFGGVTGEFNNTPSDDLWEFDTATRTWAEIHQAGPSGRRNHTLTYDPLDGSFIAFGGWNGGQELFNDIWKYDPTAGMWTEETPIIAPQVRMGHSAAFDSARGLLMIFGGHRDTETYFNDLWAYDTLLKSWSLVPVSPPFSGTIDTGMVFDTNRDTLLLFGGDDKLLRDQLFEFNPLSNLWREIKISHHPKARSRHDVAWDPVQKEMAVFGGQDGVGFLNDFWTYEAAATPTPTPTPPPIPYTPTPTPYVSCPSVFLAGYWDSDLTATDGGMVKMLALMDPSLKQDAAGVDLYFNGNALGLHFRDDGQGGDIDPRDGLWWFQVAIPSPGAAQRALWEVGARNSRGEICSFWPYYTVGP